MSRYYILDEKTPVPVANPLAWAKWFEKANRTVAKTQIDTDEVVSTVFLGIDHQWGGGPPLLFETLVIGGDYDGEMVRTSTWDKAKQAHQATVKLVMARSE